jgi:predicted nucleic acid-binding protein
MADLEQRLANHNLIGLDTSIFIYHLEGQATYLPLTREILGRVETGQNDAVVSTVTIMELTVHPWRVHRSDVARQYEVLLVNFPHLQLVDVTRDVARKAAQLRAQYNLRPADALQVGTAMISGATLWVSNDKKLKRLEPETEILILDEYVGLENN